MDQEHLFITAAIAASVALGMPVARADDPFTGLDARVQAIARQGPDALRHFVFRTRMIYALDFHDYTQADRDTSESDPGPQGFWAGVPGFEADASAWIEAAGIPPEEPTAGRD